jgi:hypothetical protein
VHRDNFIFTFGDLGIEYWGKSFPRLGFSKQVTFFQAQFQIQTRIPLLRDEYRDCLIIFELLAEKSVQKLVSAVTGYCICSCFDLKH